MDFIILDDRAHHPSLTGYTNSWTHMGCDPKLYSSIKLAKNITFTFKIPEKTTLVVKPIIAITTIPLELLFNPLPLGYPFGSCLSDLCLAVPHLG